jgi:DNA-directed RNA polymerase specialized sigma24 family protein
MPKYPYSTNDPKIEDEINSILASSLPFIRQQIQRMARHGIGINGREDLEQEMLGAAIRGLRRYRAGSKATPRSFACKCALNRLIDIGRRKTSALPTFSLVETDQVAAGAPQSNPAIDRLAESILADPSSYGLTALQSRLLSCMAKHPHASHRQLACWFRTTADEIGTMRAEIEAVILAVAEREGL